MQLLATYHGSVNTMHIAKPSVKFPHYYKFFPLLWQRVKSAFHITANVKANQEIFVECLSMVVNTFYRRDLERSLIFLHNFYAWFLRYWEMAKTLNHIIPCLVVIFSRWSYNPYVAMTNVYCARQSLQCKKHNNEKGPNICAKYLKTSTHSSNLSPVMWRSSPQKLIKPGQQILLKLSTNMWAHTSVQLWQMSFQT